MIESSRHKKPHGIDCSQINGLLDRYAEARGVGYVVCNDAGVVLEEDPGTVVGPDVAYFTDMAAFDEVAPKWSDTPPVLAVEVLSPTDRPSQVNEQVHNYLAGGARVVDYEERKVTVYRHNRTHVVLKESATLSGDPDLPGFDCTVAALFRIPGQKPTA